MTAQIPERLSYQGESVALCSIPLAPFLEQQGKNQIFQMTSTANWRGYVGRWKIADNKLFLIGLQGRLKDGKTASLKALFPTARGPVFADWYSGKLRVPQGELREYVHLGFGSQYERDLLIEIRDGIVVATTVRVNEADLADDCHSTKETAMSPGAGIILWLLKLVRR